MEGVFGDSAVSVIKDWVKNGAVTELKKKKTTTKGKSRLLKTDALESMKSDLSELEQFASMRPFIGQGAVH